MKWTDLPWGWFIAMVIGWLAFVWAMDQVYVTILRMISSWIERLDKKE